MFQTETNSSHAPAPRTFTASPRAVDGAVLALDGDGTIWDCSTAADKLFQYRRDELVGRHISLLLPELEDGRLADHGPPALSLEILCRIDHTFAARRRDGQCFTTRLSLARLGNAWIAACRDPLEKTVLRHIEPR